MRAAHSMVVVAKEDFPLETRQPLIIVTASGEEIHVPTFFFNFNPDKGDSFEELRAAWHKHVDGLVDAAVNA